MGRIFCTSLLFVCCLALGGPLVAGPRVEVVVGPQAPALEQLAARQLADQFKRLFDADVQIGSSVPDGAAAKPSSLILVGSPATNPAIQTLGAAFPRLSDQGHALKSVKHGNRPALLVGGGSPVATYWSACELGRRFGIRYLLFGDLYPASPPEFKLDGPDAIFEPALRQRTWQTMGDSPVGPSSWGLEEYDRVLRQLAKLKYNREILEVSSSQPFVAFSFKGVKKQTGELWHGQQFQVDGATPGRSVFRGAKLFENPDFAGKTTYAERLKAGQQLARNIIDTAHVLGMTAGLLVSPLEFPGEFDAVLPKRAADPKAPPGTGREPAQAPDDPLLLEAARTQVQAWLAAYPAIDLVHVAVPEYPAWSTHFDAATKRFQSRKPTAKPLDLHLPQRFRSGSTPGAGNTHVTALHAQVVGLEFIDRLLADPKLLERSDGTRLPAIVDGVYRRAVPAVQSVSAAAGVVIDINPHLPRIPGDARSLDELVKAAKVPAQLRLPLSGLFLPGTLPGELIGQDANALAGCTVQFTSVGDVDADVYYLSLAAFGSPITRHEAIEDLLGPVCGEEVADRVIKGFDMMQSATLLRRGYDPRFEQRPLMWFYESHDPPPELLGEARDLYLNAMNEMYRANTRAREGGRPFTLYFARRFEFAFEYMNAVEAVRLAGLAKVNGNRDTQLADLEKALESMDGALNALAAVARSNSDRGMIAYLNEFAYRPILQEIEALEDAAK